MAFRKGQTGNEQAKFKPGQSGNLAGRPKGKSLSGILAELGEMKASEVPERLKKLTDSEGLTHNEVVALQLVYKAAYLGNLRAIKEIFDRTEGRSVQRTQLSGPDGEGIPLRFTGIEIVKPEE